jgi:carboxypeptidase family protein
VRVVVALVLLGLCCTACGSSSSSAPPAPTTAPTPTPTPAPTLYKVTGTVTDAQTGRGIASAVVQVVDGADANKAAVTASDGAFSLTGLTPADITLRVTATGYGVLNRAISLKADGRLDAVLQKSLRTITGTVTDATSGGVLPKVTVGMGGATPGPPTTLTDASGNYTLTGVTSDASSLTAAATSYLNATWSLPAGGDTVQNFVMVRVASPPGPTPLPTPAPTPGNPAGSTVISFSQLSALPYSESGFTVVSTLAAWFASGYGRPGPSLQFSAPVNSTVEGEVKITAGGSMFRFSSVDVYSSITQIPYVLTGIAGSSTVFAVTGRQGNTFGNFVTVANPQSSVAIDTLLIRLTDTVPNICCGGNPMGIDNVVVVR